MTCMTGIAINQVPRYCSPRIHPVAPQEKRIYLQTILLTLLNGLSTRPANFNTLTVLTLR